MIATMENVIKRYGETTALDHMSLDVSKGEILGLLGPNGAGKTTVIRILCGLIGTDAGSVHVFGQMQNAQNLQTRKNMGLVTQEITVFNDLSATENLRYFGGLYGLRGTKLAQNVQETLEFVGLTEHAKKRPGKFSGGMQRRLNIACALVHKPKFLIMDEPTVGIDPQSRNHILESVKQIAQNGTTVLYTSHYMEEVQTICSRIAIMDAGRVIAEGGLSELIERIQHEDKVSYAIFSILMTVIAMLAGFWFPIDIMPQALRYIGALFPAYWASNGISALLTDGITVEYWMSMVAIAFFAAAYLLYGGKRNIT